MRRTSEPLPTNLSGSRVRALETRPRIMPPRTSATQPGPPASRPGFAPRSLRRQRPSERGRQPLADARDVRALPVPAPAARAVVQVLGAAPRAWRHVAAGFERQAPRERRVALGA